MGANFGDMPRHAFCFLLPRAGPHPPPPLTHGLCGQLLLEAVGQRQLCPQLLTAFLLAARNTISLESGKEKMSLPVSRTQASGKVHLTGGGGQGGWQPGGLDKCLSWT